MAAKHDDLAKAAEAVGPGGWVVVMARPGDAQVLNQFLTDYPQVNVVIRTHWPDTVPDEDWARSWTATLGSLDTVGKKVFIMPWNEPNMPREAGGEASVQTVANWVKDYTSTFMSLLDEAGLLHTKYEMLSPMINQSGANFLEFVDALGGANYFNQFYGISMNLYDFERDCGSQPLCHGNPFLNAGSYREILAQLGIPDAKVFALETGIVDQSGTCPPEVTDCPIFEVGPMYNLLVALQSIWANDPNFIMGSPLSYNPELRDHPDWLLASIVGEFIKSLRGTGGPIPAAWSEDLQREFEEWLAEQMAQNLIALCQDSSLAYAVPERLREICEALGLFPGGGSITEPRRIGSAYGQSFIWTKTVCWDNYTEAISAIIQGIETKISDTQQLASSLEVSNENLLLPAEENESEGLESTGEIGFEACILNTRDYFEVKESIKIQIPDSYELASTNATQLAGYLSLPESSLNRLTRFHDSNNPGNSYLAQKLSNSQIINQPAVLADATSCPNIGFSAWGEGGRLCWGIEGVTGVGYDACDWGYEITVGGVLVAGIPMVGGGGNCLIKPPESGATRITCHDGGAVPVSFSGSQTVGLNITQVSGAQDCRPDFTRTVDCAVRADGEIVCTDASGNPIAAPERPECLPRDNKGEPLDSDVNVANSGAASIPIRHGSSQESFWDVFGRAIGVCKRRKFVFTPITNVPFTFPDEGIQRGLYQLMSLPGDEEAFNFLDSETQENAFGVQSKGSREAFDTDLDIFGQKGVENAYDYTKELLTPPGW